MNHLRQNIHPGLRGALFYAMYWGAIGMYEPFLTLYFLRQGITAEQIGWLAAVLPLCTMLIAPLVSRLADHLHRRVGILALAGVGSALWLLVIVLVVSSGIGLYYYLRVIATLFRPAPERGRRLAVAPSVSLAGGLALAGLLVLLVWLGVYPSPLIQMIQTVAAIPR